MSESFPWGQKAAETACPSTGLTEPAPVEDDNQPDLLLRVCGSSHHGKLLRLRSAKCSIGSGPQCTLRLHSPRFRPVHCLILRGPNATVVRSWAPETLLNGQPFVDAPLAPGDRLKVGPIELEVVELGRPAAERPASGASHGHASPWRAEQDILALLEQAAVGRDDNDHSSCFQVPASDDSAGKPANPLHRPQLPPDDAAAFVDATSALLRRQEAALRTARQRNRRLLKRLRELKARLGELEEVQDSGLNVGAEAGDRNRRSGELGQLSQYDTGGDTIEPCYAEQTGSSWQQEPAPPERSELSGDQPNAQPKASAPVDLAEVFRRIGVAGQLLDIAEEETASSSSSADTTPVPSAGRAAEASINTHPEQPHPEGDDAIDVYMQQLLQRLRGSQSRSDVGEPRENRRTAVSAAKGVSAPAGNGSELPTAVCPQNVGPATAEFPPEEAPGEATARALPPEKLTGLSAMREVANISAQAALTQHARRTLARTRRFKLLASMASTGCGGALLWLWAEYRLPMATFAIGLMSLTAGVVWAIQYAVLTGRLVLHRSQQPQPRRQSGRPQTGAQPQPLQCSPTGRTQAP